MRPPPTIRSASPPWSRNKLYPVIRAKRLSTKYGMTAVFTLWTSDANVVQVFLPQRYNDVVTDADILSINSECTNLNLVYKRVCESSKAYILAVESSP